MSKPIQIRRLFLLPALVAAVLVVACRADRPATDGPLETVDVAPPPTIDPSTDPKARVRAPALRGALPEDFPDDVPLFLPASVAGFGTEGRRRWVDFETSRGRAEVRRSLAAKLAAAGWSGNLGEAGGDWRKGTRVLRVDLAEAAAGTTRYRLTVGL